MTPDNQQQDLRGDVDDPHGYSHEEDSSLGSPVGGRGSRRRGSRHRGSRRRGSRHRSHRGGMCDSSGYTGGRKRRKSKSSKHPKKNHKKSRTRRRRSHRV